MSHCLYETCLAYLFSCFREPWPKFLQCQTPQHVHNVCVCQGKGVFHDSGSVGCCGRQQFSHISQETGGHWTPWKTLVVVQGKPPQTLGCKEGIWRLIIYWPKQMVCIVCCGNASLMLGKSYFILGKGAGTHIVSFRSPAQSLINTI